MAKVVNTDVSRLAGPVREHAGAAGVNPVLLMAILANESYKPHIPLLERAWQKLHRDSALGVANMHRGAYERTRRGRSFARRSWKELAHDESLAVEAAAWHLHDLAARLPGRASGFTDDELLAMGYNAGARNMLRFARGTRPGAQAQAYLDRLREHWAQARDAVGTSSSVRAGN
ncbi:transglycosylase SLT domain-containing protein [Actinophytocola sp.]|uniref:transglycosylase SLT domain-containing protein n=1 Tax=Actinophytocola sp. TaxID=1872138 RepID=UPI00389B270E